MSTVDREPIERRYRLGIELRASLSVAVNYGGRPIPDWLDAGWIERKLRDELAEAIPYVLAHSGPKRLTVTVAEVGAPEVRVGIEPEGVR